MKRIAIISMAGVLGSLSAQAQTADTTMTQTLTIERAYSPVFLESNKIDRQPAVEEINVNHVKATYSDVKSESVRPEEINSMPVGQVIATYDPDHAGYVDFSLGNYWNADLKAGYKIGEFSIDASGFYTAGKLETPYRQYDETIFITTPDRSQEAVSAMNQNFDYGKWNSMLCRGNITGTYQHEFANTSQFLAHASFGGTFANIMNFGIMPYSYEDVEKNTHKEFYLRKFDSSRQQWGNMLFDAQYIAERYDIKLSYEHAGIKQPDLSENTLALNGSLLIYDDDQWLVTADLNSSVIFGEKNYFTIKPEIEVSYLPDSYSWRRLYARLGVGTRREGYTELMDRMPLVHMSEYDNAFDAVDLKLGWEDSQMGWFKYGASARLRYTKNDLNGIMCSNGMFEPAALDSAIVYPLGYPETTLDGTYAMLANEDCFRAELEAHFDYEYNEYFGAKGKVAYIYDNCKLDDMGEAHIITDLHLLGNVDKLKLDLSFEGAFDRKMSVYTIEQDVIQTGLIADTRSVGTIDSIDLGNIVDLGIRADYQFRKNLSFYAFGKNLLNHKHQLWATVPAQGINIHVGVNWKF